MRLNVPVGVYDHTNRRNTGNNFWERVDIQGENDCWNWLGGTDSHGYGKFRLNYASLYAHRYAWILANGDILEGLQVLHDPIICSNPLCCNVKHLRLGTIADNKRDPDTATINWAIVHYIRNNYNPKDKANNGVSLAKLFDISPSLVSLIVNNKVWQE